MTERSCRTAVLFQSLSWRGKEPAFTRQSDQWSSGVQTAVQPISFQM